MAVARITASAKWYRSAALAVADVPRLARELTRAADRRGLTAELMADEARILAERLPGDGIAEKVRQDAEASEARERARPRARDVIMARNAAIRLRAGSDLNERRAE